MSFNVSRRWFIGGLASMGAFGGCRIFRGDAGKYASVSPRLRFGVISDVHLRADLKSPGLVATYNTETLERTLMWYRDQGVDAVAVAGDIADRGLVAEMEAFAATWFKVFPDDKAPDGRKVERIVVYGNHDWGGVQYKSFVAAKYPGVSDHSGLILCGKPKEHWERIFHEPWEHVFRKDVKGYAFIGAQWSRGWCRGRNETGVQGLEAFFAGQKGKIDPSLPFFYFQHPLPKGTCNGNDAWGQDTGTSTKILSGFSNAVAFSGHSHYTLTDESTIWQGAFTSLGSSSLRYTGFSKGGVSHGYENGRASLQYDPYKIMRRIDTWDGRQGMLVEVYDDHVAFMRRDFMYNNSLGEDWILPLPAAESKPFEFASRAKKLPVPEFPAGAKAVVKKIRGKNRGYSNAKLKVDVPSVEKDVYEITFPSADAVAGVRAFDYQITAISDVDGKKAVKYVLPEGFNMSPMSEKAKAAVKFEIAADQLPPGKKFRFEVRARNSFRKTGSALVCKR